MIPQEISSLSGNWLLHIEWRESVASTNQWAIELLEKQAIPTPALIVAHHQTAGRGRLGRSWFADHGALACSFVLSADQFPSHTRLDSRIALVAGVAVAEAIELNIVPIRALVKWPNDVYVAGRKVAGILIEAPSACRVVVGIGINVATDFSAATEEVRGRATTMSEVAGRTVERWAVLRDLVERFRERIAEWREHPQELVKLYQQRCFLTGRNVRVQQGIQTIAGVCQGINEQGTLVVETSPGVRQQIISGEVNW